MNITLTKENRNGFAGISQVYWVFRLNKTIIGLCDVRDNPRNPSFWFLRSEHLDIAQRIKLSEAYKGISCLI